MRLAAVLGTSALYWMVLQAQYNLQTEMERREPSAPGVL
jgi:plasmid maintenance system antidote protein VapI